jgi:hypothetical protein
MRLSILLGLTLTTACSGALYSRFAGPASRPADQVYACVQAQLKELGYSRTQYDDSARWYAAQKIVTNQNASGLYRHTIEVLDTKVKSEGSGPATLEITARTLDEFANARGQDRQERKASDRVQLDARTLGQACIK